MSGARPGNMGMNKPESLLYRGWRSLMKPIAVFQCENQNQVQLYHDEILASTQKLMNFVYFPYGNFTDVMLFSVVILYHVTLMYICCKLPKIVLGV